MSNRSTVQAVSGTAPLPAEPALRLWGVPELRLGGRSIVFAPERRFQLLAVLGMQPSEWVERDRLATLLWPEHDLAVARRNLRHVVFKAREAVGGEALDATEHALRWRVATDLQRFHAALAARPPGDALALRRGPLLEGLDAAAGADFAVWLLGERARLDALWQGAAAERLAALAQQPAERAALATHMLALDPCDEAAVTALIEVELARGHRPAAERHYREFAARLAEQHGVEPAHRLRDLLRPAAAAGSAPSASAPDAGFIGRRIELAELARRLAQPGLRLLTLAGPGGVGKSSLARQSLGTVAGPWAWVELQDLADTDAAVARIAQRLGTELRGTGDPLAQIAVSLGGRRQGLVLDNAEHLAELPGVVERLLAAAAGLVMLVTSRRRLGLAGESVLALGGLAVPDDDSRDAEAAAAFDAVRLFDARACIAQRSFVLREHIAAVVEIVDAVGGSPLAIGLAASWVRLLPAQAIAADLRQALDVLERDPASPEPPSRPEHASMRAVLDGSWALLAPREREALESLSVFQGSFSHAAAREVAGVALPLLSSLVDKSMLMRDPPEHFAMHPLIAADARVRAAADDAALAARRDRHARHFLQALADTAAAHPVDHRPVVALVQSALVDGESAWRHAVAQQRNEWLQAALPGWRRYFVATGRFADGTRHFEPALRLPAGGATPGLRAAVGAALAWFAKASGDADRALALAAEVRDSDAARADPALHVDCLNTLGAAELLRARWPQARQWFAQSLQQAQAHGLRRETASAQNNLGLTSLCEGSFADCEPRFSAAAAIQREMGDHVSLARSLHNLASAHMARGDWAEAAEANMQALRYAREHGVVALTSTIEFMLGATLAERGPLDAARRHLESAAEQFRARGDAHYALKAGYYLARLDARAGRRAEGAQALLAAARQALGQGHRYDLLYIATFAGECLREAGAADDAGRVFDSVAGAVQADAFVRAVVEACRRGGPAAGAATGSAPLAFEQLAEWLASSEDLAELGSRLRSTTG